MDQIKIILVDDLSFMREAIKHIVEKENMIIIGEAENGADAVKIYTELSPDIVLMDITMPVMDGLESLKKIKEFDPMAKVIMCSALGQQKYIIKAIQFGARDFILKPFQPERIISAITKAAGIDDK
ncbi:MAG: response regulator [Spirochaetales bacterium]|nr:response regulator [Spirochaetales bacterium]